MSALNYLRIPFLFLHLICYFLLQDKQKLTEDINVFVKGYHFKKEVSECKNLIKILLCCPEFRNIFYMRIDKISKQYHIGFLMDLILPQYRLLSIGTPNEKVGKGLYIEHGNSTIISATSIGDYCWVNQNVTIGNSGKGIPVIGDNVKIGTGAVVIGPIKIGNNVIIGANATVVKNVPDNTTIVPSPSYIIKQDGERVYIRL